MTEEFKYLKEGLASDLVELLINDYTLDLNWALSTLYDSDTYTKISDPATGLYFQSSRYVYSYLQNELKNGMVGWAIHSVEIKMLGFRCKKPNIFLDDLLS